jgi:hypothetical protein
LIWGTFNGRTANGVQFTGSDGLTVSYPAEQVVSVSFGALPAAVEAPPEMVTIPVGTLILVRMVDSLDTSTAKTGQLFTATLATSLAANGSLVARTGTPVYGQVVDAQSARHATGKSKLALQLTYLVIGGNSVAIATDTYDTEGKSSGARSARRLVGGAGLGAAIGAIAGDAAMGAAIGAATGATLAVVQKGDQVQIPSEASLAFHLQAPVTLSAIP